MEYTTLAREIMDIEIEGLIAIRDNLGEAFDQLTQLCLDRLSGNGKLVLTGVGKSGHIGLKLAATLSSTGAPAAFLHPVEAMHGDLGILNSRDVLICLSYSGETQELLDVLPAAKRFGIPIVAITGITDSSLATFSDLVVPMTVPREACPFNLAPTTSTTGALALGDALAMVLMHAQSFSAEDYGKRHPGGAIGRSVTLTIGDIMRGKDRTPTVDPDMLVKDALICMTQCRSGSVIAVGEHNELLGIFTDGDFRRHVQKGSDVMNMSIHEVMTPNPISVRAEQMAVELMTLLEQREIDDIPVVNDEGKVVGLVDIQDLPKFKII